MDFVWAHGPCNAETLREDLAAAHPMKDSTARTILRRLEAKGYLRHRVEGRTYFYESSAPRENVATRAVEQIIDRLCGGSVEQLLVGMVENEIVDRRELQKLAQKIASKKGRSGK